MKHWRIEDVAWDRFDPGAVDPALVPLVKAAAMVERNGRDYALYLGRVFSDDPDFRRPPTTGRRRRSSTATPWPNGPRWPIPHGTIAAAFDRYRAGYSIKTNADASIRGSRTGELIARCMVETGTSSYYTALAEATSEPVLKQVCKLIAADEYRHFKLFYDHMRRYLSRENLGIIARLRIALGRIGESEDDELAYAYHCGNEAESQTYRHSRCTAAYMAGAMGFYRYRHIERSTGMILKASACRRAAGCRMWQQSWRGACCNGASIGSSSNWRPEDNPGVCSDNLPSATAGDRFCLSGLLISDIHGAKCKLPRHGIMGTIADQRISAPINGPESRRLRAC